MSERTITVGRDEYFVEVRPDGEVMLHGAVGMGRSRPQFKVHRATKYVGPHVDLANEDDGWCAESLTGAGHLATVLQAVMDRHLAAAREEGRLAGIAEAERGLR